MYTLIKYLFKHKKPGPLVQDSLHPARLRRGASLFLHLILTSAFVDDPANNSPAFLQPVKKFDRNQFDFSGAGCYHL